MQKTKIIFALTSFVLTLAFTASLTLAEDQYLPDVENLAGEPIPGGAKLTWNPVEGADSYTIYYGIQSISEDGASYENKILLGSVNEYTLEGLMPSITYYFSVAADDSTGTYLGSYNYSEEISVVAGEAEEPENPDPEEPVDVEDPDLENIEEDPEEEVILDVELSALEDLLGGDEYTSADPESLPQSGPATAALALVSGAGAYFWRRFRK
ncbi:MAG: fibronectin type III domain-containing protein [Patescibacteria group bacterium]